MNKYWREAVLAGDYGKLVCWWHLRWPLLYCLSCFGWTDWLTELPPLLLLPLQSCFRVSSALHGSCTHTHTHTHGADGGAANFFCLPLLPLSSAFITPGVLCVVCCLHHQDDHSSSLFLSSFFSLTSVTLRDFRLHCVLFVSVMLLLPSIFSRVWPFFSGSQEWLWKRGGRQ